MSKFRELFEAVLQEFNFSLLNEAEWKSTSNIAEVANTVVEKVNGEKFKGFAQELIKPGITVKCVGKSSGRNPYNPEQRISYYLTTTGTYPQKIKEGYPVANVEVTVEARVSDHDKAKRDPKIDVCIPQFGTEKTVDIEKYNIKKYDFKQGELKLQWIQLGYNDIFNALKEKTRQMDKDLDILKDPKVFNLLLNNSTKFLMEYDFPHRIWTSDWFINWVNQCRNVRTNPTISFDRIR